jgi:hypothetical protein
LCTALDLTVAFRVALRVMLRLEPERAARPAALFAVLPTDDDRVPRTLERADERDIAGLALN